MKTSSDLRKSDSCPNYTSEAVRVSDAMIRARAVRRTAIDAYMMHDDNLDVRGMLLSRFTATGYRFESLDQMLINMGLYEEQIDTMRHWFAEREEAGWTFERIAYDEETTVDFFGTPVKALPDFIAKAPDGDTYALRVKASKHKKLVDENSLEAYCLASYANSIKQDAHAQAGAYILHLYSESGSAVFKTADTSYETAKREAQTYMEAHQDLTTTRCSGDDCGMCSMNSICNYEEPPLAQDTLRDITPSQNIQLSNEQQDVVNFMEGKARVNAGPGAGKTLVVAFRVKHLLEEGVPAHKIALLTFTNAGAEEMTTRIKQYCDEAGVQFNPEEMTCGTFNSFCMELIQANCGLLGYFEPPRLLEDSTKYEICNRILAQFPRIRDWRYSGYADNIVGKGFMAKNQAISSLIEAFAKLKAGQEPAVPFGTLSQIKAMFARYQDELERQHYIEFDDQIVLVKKLGELDPDFYNNLGYQHIIVDEFQDTDIKQIELLQKMIGGPAFKSFMAVGDDSQSIYGFRFTTPEYMINFQRYFGEFTDLNLNTCRRCPQPIVNLANRINGLRIARATEAPLVTPKQSGLAPVIKGFYTQADEIKFVCDNIEQDLAGGVKSHEIAVLTRNKDEIERVAAELSNRGIPATICNPVPYINDSRVKAICEFWEAWQGEGTVGIAAYVNAMEHGSLKNAAPAEVEDVIHNFTPPEVRDYAGFIENAEALDNIDGEGQYDACYRNFLDLIKRNRNYEELRSFFRTFKLYGARDTFRREGKYEGVCLTTVHSAKGREWDVTYLTLSSFDKASYHRHELEFRGNGDYDENLRLWFVGATRAKMKLVMTGLYQLVAGHTHEAFQNQYVEQAYSLLQKPYDFNPRIANQIAEDARAAAAAEAAHNRSSRSAGDRTNQRVVRRRRNATAIPEEMNDLENARHYPPMTQEELEAINMSVFDLIDETPETNDLPAPARQ